MSQELVMPVLSAGAHRRPRDGGCFMEIASLLAGERWSDHPACTHPVLAAVARCVNDAVTDEGRQQLVPLIPSVIGANGTDARIAPSLVLLSTRAALRAASSAHRGDLVASRQAAERRLARHLRAVGRPDEEEATPSRRLPGVLGSAYRRWEDLGHTWSEKAYLRVDAPIAVHHAVTALAPRPRTQHDAGLRQLLVECIAECRRLSGATGGRHEQVRLDEVDWSMARQLTSPSH